MALNTCYLYFILIFVPCIILCFSSWAWAHSRYFPTLSFNFYFYSKCCEIHIYISLSQEIIQAHAFMPSRSRYRLGANLPIGSRKLWTIGEWLGDCGWMNQVLLLDSLTPPACSYLYLQTWIFQSSVLKIRFLLVNCLCYNLSSPLYVAISDHISICLQISLTSVCCSCLSDPTCPFVQVPSLFLNVSFVFRFHEKELINQCDKHTMFNMKSDLLLSVIFLVNSCLTVKQNTLTHYVRVFSWYSLLWSDA